MSFKKILVVDDEEIIRNYTNAMLEECGYRVFTAENGVVGLSLSISVNNSSSKLSDNSGCLE